jgi:hypothetical protein
MTWKAYAAVSGATVLAGWIASSPPANTPATMSSPAGTERRRQAPDGSDIEEQAARLQTRLRAERTYTAPQRNPFRFEEGGDVDPAFVEPGTAFAPARPPGPESETPAPAPMPALSLSGIAEDQMNGQISRTAVISSPAGVELVREGDEILGYRVVRVESEAVELTRISDGSPRRITLNR